MPGIAGRSISGTSKSQKHANRRSAPQSSTTTFWSQNKDDPTNRADMPSAIVKHRRDLKEQGRTQAHQSGGENQPTSSRSSSIEHRRESLHAAISTTSA